MKKKYFLFFIFLILLYAISINLSAQINLIKNQLNHFQVVFPAILSSSFITLFLTLELMYNIDLNEDITYDLVDSMLFFAILPIYFFDIPKGLLFCGVFLGLNLIADYLWDVDEDFIAQIPANGYMDFSFFSTYAIYREGRVRAKKGLLLTWLYLLYQRIIYLIY